MPNLPTPNLSNLPMPTLTNLPRQTLPMPNLPMPNLPMPNLPMPNLPMPNLPMPNLPMPNLPMPNLPMQNLPMPNLPMPNLPMPNLPMPNLPMPNLPKSNLMLPTLPKQNFSSSTLILPTLPTRNTQTMNLSTLQNLPIRQGAAVAPKSGGFFIHPGDNFDVNDVYKDIYPFNDEKYPIDSNMFKLYFSGLEYTLRLAIWTIYKYGYLPSHTILTTEIEHKHLMDQVQGATDIKEFLITLTSTFETKELLYYWYMKWDTNKATGPHIDKLFNQYGYHQDALFNRIYRKYVDKNWVDIELWF
jgi:hypothetical protein